MTAIGYIFLITGALLIRQVAVGRATETPSDLRDIAVSLLSGDMPALKNIMALRGTNVAREVSPESVDWSSDSSSSQVPDPVSGDTPGTALLRRVIELGSGSVYVWGASGPGAYDCSGLVWAAARDIGVYSGPRFTTSSIRSTSSSGWIVGHVDAYEPGDILVWPGKHMGVFQGGDRFYSARSPSKGIGSASLSADIQYFGQRPDAWTVRRA